MLNMRHKWKVLVSGFVLCAFQLPSYAVDSASLETGYGNKTRLVRAGLQWDWQNKWWQSEGSHLGGYWDLTLARWHSTRFQNLQGSTQNLTSIGITPVFRLQNDTAKGLYGEAGIGIHYLSDLYDNNGRKLSTRFEFGDHVGLGYVFRNNFDLGLKLQHFSNGGIKKPNNGLNFAVIRAKYEF